MFVKLLSRLQTDTQRYSNLKAKTSLVTYPKTPIRDSLATTATRYSLTGHLFPTTPQTPSLHLLLVQVHSTS